MRHITRRNRALALAVLLTVLTVPAAGGASGAPQITPSQGRAAMMQHHFDSVIRARNAVSRGDLSEARAEARLVRALPDPAGLPESGMPHLRALRDQAERAEKAADLEQAAAATASMLAACGDCHRAVGTMPAFPTPTEPKIGGVLGHMEEHKVAADLLAEGLTTPSSSLWMDGAAALATASLHRADLPDTAKISRNAIQAEANIHGLAKLARTTRDTAGRVRIYSQLIMSCSTCHAANGGAGPLPRSSNRAGGRNRHS